MAFDIILVWISQRWPCWLYNSNICSHRISSCFRDIPHHAVQSISLQWNFSKNVWSFIFSHHTCVDVSRVSHSNNMQKFLKSLILPGKVKITFCYGKVINFYGTIVNYSQICLSLSFVFPVNILHFANRFLLIFNLNWG